MTITATSTAPITVSSTKAPSLVRPAVKPILKAGAVSGLVAAVATTLVVVAAKAVDVPMKAAPRTEDFGRAIPLSGFASGTLMCTAIGVVIAVVLARTAKRPAPIFLGITTVLTLVSFFGPITTGYATTATRLVLALTHVVAAAIVIPAIARTLEPQSAPR